MKLKIKKATMFAYSEHYSDKGPNEVLSCSLWYVSDRIPADTKCLHVFMDICFSQYKNKYIFAFWQHLVNTKFDNIYLYYPMPGHSFMPIDGAFGKIAIARGSVVGWGTMLRVGRSRVRFPVWSLDFSIDLILPAAL
jgi:hypothetical protein